MTSSEERRREVPDSEDEPMTSSPVTVSDGAADKLFATARVPLQDAQGAPKEATRHHQAPAESDANVHGERIDGLDADRLSASVDVDSSKHEEIDMQPDTSTSSHVVLVKMTSVPDAALPIPTDSTMHKSEPTCHGHRSEATPEHTQLSSLGTDEPKLILSTGEEQAPAQGLSSDTCINGEGRTDREHDAQLIGTASLHGDCDKFVSSGDGKEVPEAQQETTGSSGDTASDGVNHAVAIGSGSQAPHDGSDGQKDAENTVLMQDVTGRTYANDQSYVETRSESTSTATDAGPSSMSIEGESQSTMKDDASAPGFSISMVSSTSSPSTNIPQRSGESSTDTAVSTAPGTFKSGAVSTTQLPVTANGASTIPASVISPLATATAEIPVNPKTTQEITLAGLKAQKAAMLASLATLPAIQVLMEETASSNADMFEVEDEPTEVDIMAAANKIVKDHIKLLHEYNELKDVGQGLMGLIADQRGVRIVEVQEEFGIEAND